MVGWIIHERSRRLGSAPLTPVSLLPAFTSTDQASLAHGSFDINPFTTGSLNIGTPTADRVVIFAAGCITSASLTGVQINTGGGPVSMSSADAVGLSSGRDLGIWYKLVTTGNTAVFTVNTSGAMQVVACCVGYATGINPVPTTAAHIGYTAPSDPFTGFGLTTPNPGFQVAAGWIDGAGSLSGWATNWTPGTLANSGNGEVSMARNILPGTQTPAFSRGNFIGSMIVQVSWGQ